MIQFGTNLTESSKTFVITPDFLNGVGQNLGNHFRLKTLCVSIIIIFWGKKKRIAKNIDQ
jgi:hypothetical protein